MSTHPLVESSLQSDDLAGWLVEQHQTAKSTERFRRETDRLFFEQWARTLADCPNEICQTKIETLSKVADQAEKFLDGIITPALVGQCLRGATREIRAAAAEALHDFGFLVAVPQEQALAAAPSREEPEESRIRCGDTEFAVLVSKEGGDLCIELATSALEMESLRLQCGDAEPVVVRLKRNPQGTQCVGEYILPAAKRRQMTGDTVRLLPPLS